MYPILAEAVFRGCVVNTREWNPRQSDSGPNGTGGPSDPGNPLSM